MINKLLKYFWGKELILYNSHRNSEPLVNEINKKKYVFFDPLIIWKATALLGRKSRIRYKFMYLILTFFSPVYIIDINWISKLHSLYLVWCNNHNRSFIVVQHGIYHGGIVKYIPEKYVKCNIFLVWGKHFKEMYEANNKGKNFQCIPFGNPCYNVIDRALFSYKEEIGKRILIAVSVMDGYRLEALNALLVKLEELGFDVTVKEHAMQMKKASVSLKGFKKISGNLYQILQGQEYDIIITDVSSAMTDIIFFKNRAIYYSPEEEGKNLNENIYSNFLKNLVCEVDDINSIEDLKNYVDIEAQENLLQYLIETEGTNNDLSRLRDLMKESSMAVS